MALLPSDVLPKLRQDLRLLRAPSDEDGAPRWQLFDPLNNKFFFFSKQALTIFRAWTPMMPADDFLEKVRGFDDSIEKQDLEFFLEFVKQNNLTLAKTSEDKNEIYQKYQLSKKSWTSWLVHNYLFFKIPLLKPAPFLDALYPKVKWLFSSWLSALIIILGITGLLLTIRQWDIFLSTFDYFFSWDGLVAYGAALIFVKSAHEFGHAIVAKHYQCRVGSIGIAFLVMLPVFYTDTTDAWRLKSRSQRLRVVTAGVKVELYLAMIATFLWSFLPEGSLKSIAFFIATTSWVSSLLINISPFLRFDGYYALSDLTGYENLQPRSFAVGRWYLRKIIFGFNETPPEPLNDRKQRFFVSYAWATWIYRFLLFLGIAVLVYFFAFKLLGILLFLIEIIWFILLPIWRELKVWWLMKENMRVNNSSIRTLVILIGFMVFFFYPWQTFLSVPAVIKSTDYREIFVPVSASVLDVKVETGQTVVKGEVLAILESNSLNQKIKLAELNVERLKEAVRRSGSSVNERETFLVNQQALEKEQTQLEALLEQKNQMFVRSPMTGRVVDKHALNPRQWVDNRTPLFSINTTTDWEVHAFVSAFELNSIHEHSSAVFISDTGVYERLALKVSKVLPLAVNNLPYQELASSYGGSIATRVLDNRLIPEQPIYEVILIPEASSEFWKVNRRESGTVVLKGTPESFFAQLQRTVLSVLVREAGF